MVLLSPLRGSLSSPLLSSPMYRSDMSIPAVVLQE